MQMKAPWLKPGVWGAVIGAVITMILGFSWMGWILGGTAERLAMERSNTAVVVALTPVCTPSSWGNPTPPPSSRSSRRSSRGSSRSSSSGGLGHHDRREGPRTPAWRARVPSSS